MDKVQAQLQAVKALAEAIQDLKSVPSGHLYAHVMGHMSLSFYESAISFLVEQGWITNNNNLLTWVGWPKAKVYSNNVKQAWGIR